MEIHVLDPLSDSRWNQLVAGHPEASVFHQRGWLRALARTYGYEPYVLTSTPFGRPLENGIVLCRISSWITGSRLVSLPFSDHCQPLLNECAQAEDFLEWMRGARGFRPWSYLELRPLFSTNEGINNLQPSCSYWFHDLSLQPSLDELFGQLHRNSFQRKIHRAEREGLLCDKGRSEHLMDDFYRLLLRTRRRHQALPQPRSWFKNLLECMGEKVLIRVARKDGIPIAAMLTLHHRSTVIYKYGCSDAKFHSVGGMPLLFWRLIEESKQSGVEKIDLGRTDLDNQGLITFKDRLASRRRLLTYYRYTTGSKRPLPTPRSWRVARQIFSLLPDTVSSAAGRVFYRHLG